MNVESTDTMVARRGFLIGVASFGASLIAGCAETSANLDTVTKVASALPQEKVFEKGPIEINHAQIYAPVRDSGFDLPAIPYIKIPRQFLRTVVENSTGEPEGTLVVDTETYQLYLTLADGIAIRYGVGLGSQSQSLRGQAVVQWKRKWPKWTPPEDMIGRRPHLAKWRDGMPPGLYNPLGCRALYIFRDGQDTLFRIHGNPEWTSIGKSVSSGCVRMFQQDAIDLYDRVPHKATLVVI